ncbi:unnamed protein product (macronuclear) [Paramecium tetraurelia]|uniref:Chromosome undetermined scaffold_29, whole genome shotgun sequence n=1 Tax=Paramecium tetraurelia TaxID=5888 RepID=Q3SCZ1_PARTE|nr:uncharacterized protein GSPATT00010876001 [Paramecium tetraurelia]CAI44574.1 rab_A18 [Paramecium tetraurelia]CAK74708.1 unnamed protein product [Paramecium tetraurelia]|eukprot:XP_001442105.1 hypothetical protein (macronuclear) [Paramecium tetraurelia strain d4-2]
MDQYHFLFKYIIVGDTSVGKSCILLNYTEKKFNEDHETTIGVEFGSQLLKMNDRTIKIQIWDTAGQESFRSITRSYYKGSIGVVLVFDLTKKDTYYNVMKWHNEILDCTHEFVEISLVGNKLDLESERQVSSKEALEYAQSNKMNYLETSAKTGQNVDKVFEDIAQRILVKIDNKTIDYTQEVYGIKLGPFFQNPKQITNTPSTLKSEPEKKDKTCC